MPASVNLPFTSFPRDFTKLANLSFVVPDLNHDMHDGTVAAGDLWLRNNLGGYISWAATHNSLLVLTWDEDDRSQSNRILTVVGGAPCAPAATPRGSTTTVCCAHWRRWKAALPSARASPPRR